MIDAAIEGGFKAAATARQVVDRLRGELPEELVDDIRFLVNELVTNSVRHGRVGAHQRIWLKVYANDGAIRVEVRDPGPGFTYKPRDASMDERSGWGLHLVDRIADRWGLERDEHTCVWFELDEKSAGERPLSPAVD